MECKIAGWRHCEICICFRCS